MRHRPIQFLLLLAWCALFSCHSTPSTVIFHSDLGKMTVRIFPGLPAEAANQLRQLLAAPADSLAVGKVLHDGFIQLNFQATAPNTTPESDRAPVSGAFVVSGGRFFIVQGRAHTDATLDKWVQTTGHSISPTFREQYKKNGGSLQLEGRCTVLGALVSGKEALDRIAALPSDANGRPLRVVPVRLEAGQ